jgi:hypothetical protein
MKVIPIFAFLLASSTLYAQGYFPETADPYFLYDPEDVTVEGELLDHPLYHDSGIASVSGKLWMTWLEYVPGEGEHIWIGKRTAEGWEEKVRFTEKAGIYQTPTLTVAGNGKVYLSYETETVDQWDIHLVSIAGDLHFGSPTSVTESPTSDIAHEIVADLDGGLWIVWQGDNEGQFDIYARKYKSGELSAVHRVSDSPRGDWAPSAALLPDGKLVVVWDLFNGSGYDVVGRVYSGTDWGNPFAISNNPYFEARAKVVSDDSGRVWVTWEEGGKYWGHEYRSGIGSAKVVMGLHDERGPLHRYRRFHLAQLDPENLTVAKVEPPLPTPAEEDALLRADSDTPPEPLGVFYERSEPVVDSAGRLWILYRHFYAEGIATSVRHHVEEGWGVYARYLGEGGWSPLYRLFPDQGDMMQRLEAVPHGEGIAVTWTTGRTDRRPARTPLGVCLARLEGEGGPPPSHTMPTLGPLPSPQEPLQRKIPPTFAIEDKIYHLYYGDLHRHTDLSLCRSPVDGSVDDAYRYATDVADHDFFGITDHSRDLAMGDELSLLWRRCRKEVTRHQLCDTFVPFFSYERSRSDTDHNVISLRDDMLRQHTYPLPQFWEECDDDTITIPHPPFFNEGLWEYNNDTRRPLLEIYQGCRDTTAEVAAHEGLSRDYKFGFIASSDHLSTNASFACVWAEEPTRESIFRALQKRRTYGATSKIEMRAMAGDYWMGEEFTAGKMPPIEVRAEGTAPIQTLNVVVDGETVQTHPIGETDVNRTLEIDLSPGRHYVYIKLNQVDGNLAWASPFFVEIGPE